MARTSWSTSTARSCSERLPHPPRSVRLASRRSLCARQCSRVGDFRHFVTAITGGGWVLCEVKALSHGTKGQSNGYHRFGYYRRDRIRRLVGLYGCAVEGWEGGCLCGVGSDLTACDYVALASRRNTGRILTDIAASEPLVIRPPRSARLAASALARRSAVRCTGRRSRARLPENFQQLQPLQQPICPKARDRAQGLGEENPPSFPATVLFDPISVATEQINDSFFCAVR